jgi:hypothetical protein
MNPIALTADQSDAFIRGDDDVLRTVAYRFGRRLAEGRAPVDTASPRP